MRPVLPIDALLPLVRQEIAPSGSTLLLQAPPGAGKTTRVPITVQQAIDGLVWVLEPRRIAARTAAQRMATELGERPGETVGYSVRLESRVSAATRIEVLTEGLFLRRLQADPALSGVDCLIFDEFHERHADGDLALALVRQARDLVRPDLRLVVMSATLTIEPLAQQLPQARQLTSEGRAHPVAVVYQVPRAAEPLAQQVVRALEEHWLDQHGPGDCALVFLPGLGEIRSCERRLLSCPWGESLEVMPLHGNLSLAEQARVIAPAPGRSGRVVLATGIAESSLTIAGVSLVIDSGLSRRNRFDPARGLDGLVTVPSSQASAEQRAGRGGRLGPGRCIRLWSAAEQGRRPAHDTPELLECDPLPLSLQLAEWGDPLGADLAWIDAPPAAALKEARAALVRLGALNSSTDGCLSAAGRAMTRLGMHPRLARLVLNGRARGQSRLGCELAVLLSERDPLDHREAGSDLLRRLDWLRAQPSRHPSRQLLEHWWHQLAALPADAEPLDLGPGDACLPAPEDLAAGLLVAAAFPERLALAREGQQGRYLLRSGRGAVLRYEDPLCTHPVLAVAHLDGAGMEARIQLALPLPLGVLRDLALESGETDVIVSWDEQALRVRCERRLLLGALQLERHPCSPVAPEKIRLELLGGLRRHGLSHLPWRPAMRQLQQRLTMAHQHRGAPWPDRSDSTMLRDLEGWLAPWIEGMASLADLQGLDLEGALWGDLGWSQRAELDQLLPAMLAVPTGRTVRLDYSSGEPVLAVKLQELFGCTSTPAVLDGELPVTLHLLSPAGRPAAITKDLASFWAMGYRDVRRELRGRYPRHPWPEDGASATPTGLTKARLQADAG